MIFLYERPFSRSAMSVLERQLGYDAIALLVPSCDAFLLGSENGIIFVQ